MLIGLRISGKSKLNIIKKARKILLQIIENLNRKVILLKTLTIPYGKKTMIDKNCMTIIRPASENNKANGAKIINKIILMPLEPSNRRRSKLASALNTINKPMVRYPI